jgi:iron complex transport system substrate-binding protein
LATATAAAAVTVAAEAPAPSDSATAPANTDAEPSSTIPATPDTGFTSSDAAAEDAASAWTTVFDSTIAFDDKAAHLAEASALRPTIESYTAVGASMGGIMLVPTAVVVVGDVAMVTYDVIFGGTAAYTALTGEIERLDGEWVVSRDEFCDFMASARNPCS